MVWPEYDSLDDKDALIPNVEYVCDFNIELDEDSMEAKLQDLLEKSLLNRKYRLLKLVATVEVKP